jgi:Putative polyhydroxyalkanoic acid system protein (PHA_gran_rgn)
MNISAVCRAGLHFAARLPTSVAEAAMSKPLVVSIPHRLGKAEAVRRLKSGLASAQSDFKHIFTVQEETWVGDSLTFRISALGQSASGMIDVREDHVLMEVQLPWLLHQIAEKAQGLIRKRGQLLLEKK